MLIAIAGAAGIPVILLAVLMLRVASKVVRGIARLLLVGLLVVLAAPHWDVIGPRLDHLWVLLRPGLEALWDLARVIGVSLVDIIDHLPR